MRWFFLIALLLAAEPSTASTGPTTVTVWHSYRGAERKALEAVAERFNQRSTGTRLKLLAQPNDSYASKLTTSIPRGHGPDVFIFGHDRIGSWAESKIIAPLPRPPADEFLEETLEPMRYGDEFYGLPLAFKSTLLFYNKDLVSTPPSTTDELIAVAERLSNERRVGLAYLYDDFYYHALWHFGFGAELWREDGTFAIDSDESVAALKFVRDLVDRGLLPLEPTGALVARLFNSGNAAMAIHGPWFIGEISSEINFGVAPLPIISGRGTRARPFLTTEAVFLSAHSRHRKAAIAVLQFLAGYESALIRAVQGRQAVAHTRAWQSEKIASDELLVTFRMQLRHTRPMGNQPRDRTVWEPSMLMLNRLIRGKATPQAAVRSGIRRHDAITRPTPPRKSAIPYLILALVLATILVGLIARSTVHLRDPIQRRLAARGWTWISPAVVGTLVLLFIPFAVGLAISLFAHRDGNWIFVGFANFIDILGAKTFSPTEPLSFYFALGVTILWTALNVLFHVALGLALALLLSRRRLRLKPIYRVLLIIPWAVPNYITALIWKAMFSTQHGVINSILESFGLDRVSWFSSFPTAFFANLCANAWLGFPFMMVVCLGALQSIPRDLYEAADVDGATGVQKFRHITLPLLRPALLPAILIGTVWTFNQFNIVYLVSGGDPDGSTDILISEAYRWAFSRQEQYGYAAAYAALIFLILLCWSVVSTRISRRLETSE